MSAVLASLAFAAQLHTPVQTPVITLERTACFGVCPVYKVAIQEDGTVQYQGWEHVRVPGAHTWQIDPAAVAALAREMQEAGFFGMKNTYTMPVTDMPTTYTTLTIGGSTKRVKDYMGAPLALSEIEARIDEVSGAKGYVRVSAAVIRDKQQQGWRATDDEARKWMLRATSEGDATVVKALLDAGASARGADGDGVTLVMRAAASGDPATVRALMAAGGDPTARDKWGRNAADRARDGLKEARIAPAPVEATGRPRDYALVLRILTDE